MWRVASLHRIRLSVPVIASVKRRQQLTAHVVQGSPGEGIISLPSTVRENCLAGMSFRQRSGPTRIAEVRRPLPVPDLGHILQVPADVVVMLIQLLSKQLDCIRRLQTKPRNMLQRIESEVKAAHFVQHHHVEGRGGCTAVHVTMHVEAAFIGAPMNEGMNEPAIVMKGKYYWSTLREDSVE